MKKQVNYKIDTGVGIGNFIKVGSPAFVVPTNHPNCSNIGVAKTSKVISYDKETGIFETLYSIYYPVKA